MAQKRRSIDVVEECGGTAMCANGCGFFGNAATGGMCSKCHRENAAGATAEKKKTHQAVFDTPLRTTAPAEKKAKIACAAVASSPESGADAAAAQAQTPLGFQCCCGETFCGAHRYAEKHACGFDYKRAGRERIDKNNPVVVADKIAKIL